MGVLGESRGEMRDQRFAKPPIPLLGNAIFAHGQFPHSTSGSSTELPVKRTPIRDTLWPRT